MDRDRTDMENPEKTLQDIARDFGILLDDRQLSRFRLYRQELLFWNEKMSLVAIKSVRDVTVKHFADSLTLVPLLPPGGHRLLDIGSGAGFPGIPLKIAVDALDVTLVEPSRKKVSFLKTLVRNLSLDGVTVIHGRAEEIRDEEAYRHRFDIVTSRALFKLPELIPAAAPFLAPGGVLMAMKGRFVDDEITAGEGASQREHLAFSTLHRFTLPGAGEKRAVVVYVKSA